MALLTVLPQLSSFEAFRTSEAATEPYLIRWRYIAYFGITPVEVWVDTEPAAEDTPAETLRDGADVGMIGAYEALGYTNAG